MIYRVVVVITFLIFSKSILAQSKFSFSDFDYPNESVLYGSKNRTSYFIPVQGNSIQSDSEIFLSFKASDVLDKKNSFITVVVAGIPISTVTPSLDNSIINIRVPLSSKSVLNGYIKIEVIADLKISDEICEIYNEGAFWVRRLPSSYIILNTSKENSIVKSPRHMSDFLHMADKILLPENPDLSTVSYASYIKFYYHEKFNQELEIGTLKKSDTIGFHNALLLGKLSDLPASVHSKLTKLPDESEGVLSMAGFGDTKDSLGTYNSLIITGGNDKGLKKAALTLLDDDMVKSLFTNQVNVYQSMDVRQVNNNIDLAYLNLKSLGVEEGMIEGIGKMSREITIPRSIFGSSLKEMDFHLNFNYKPIKISEDAYVNIFLDDVLKESHELNESGTFSKEINFDHFELKKNNVLKIEFYFVPDGGLCISNPTSFYAQLDLLNSSIKPISLVENPELNFFNFPENFKKLPTRIYWNTQVEVKSVNTLVKLITRLNSTQKINSSYYFPPIVPIDSLDSSSDSEYNKIIISDELEPFKGILNNNAYLNVSNDRFSYKSEHHNQYFNLEYLIPVGFNQLFRQDNNEIMFVYTPQNNQRILDNLLNKMDSDYLSNTGNVIIANSEDSHFFNLQKENVDVEKEQLETSFNSIWQKYRVFLIFGCFILMVVLLVYVFQKSQQSKKNITDD